MATESTAKHSTSTEVESKQENPLYNLLFNIILPVVILNQLSKRLGVNGPLIALIAALALPISYGIIDYIKRKKRNYISILGILNVLFTGGLALLNVSGLWFALKEAFFPLLIGVAVLVSNLFDQPFLKTLFWNNKIFKTDLIESRIQMKNNNLNMNTIFKRSTYLFAFSFLISAGLNFYLASQIFLPIDPSLEETAKSEMLNQQIAQMTWKGYIVIALPMMVFMGFILWYVIHSLKKISGLRTDEILVTEN